jgi:molybdate transport system substrate-binding protein
MTEPLKVLAAGSLRRAFGPLLKDFTDETGIPAEAEFGPAGLLRARIEAGEPCSIFVSANAAHAEALVKGGIAKRCRTAARDRLGLVVMRGPKTDNKDWVALLSDESLRIGTSTPGDDPGGDYAQAFFEKGAEKAVPGLGTLLKARAVPMAGGRHSPKPPAGMSAAAWLLGEGRCDVFTSYAHNALSLDKKRFRAVKIPEAFNVECRYTLALIADTPEAEKLESFITGPQGRRHLLAAGFLPPDDRG